MIFGKPLSKNRKISGFLKKTSKLEKLPKTRCKKVSTSVLNFFNPRTEKVGGRSKEKSFFVV